jgi:hypothetical protein
VVSPTDQQATLGKMRNAMRDAPAKWAYVLGDLDVESSPRTWCKTEPLTSSVKLVAAQAATS